MNERHRRARAIQKAIREILVRQWDPFEIVRSGGSDDEFDTYIGGVYRLLANDGSELELARHLAKVEHEAFGSDRPDVNRLLPVARRLKQLDVRLDPSA